MLIKPKQDKINKTDFFISYGPLPKYLNLLDKYEFIQYNGLKIPRIPLDENNSIHFIDIIYGNVIHKNLPKIKKNELCDYNSFGDSEEDKNENLSINKNSCEIIINKEELNLLKNNKYLLNYNSYKEEKKIYLNPPKRLISIFNNINNKINKNNLEINCKKNNNIVNNIIFNNINNINLFTNNIYIQNIIISPININNNSKIKTVQNINNYFHLESFPNISNLNDFLIHQMNPNNIKLNNDQTNLNSNIFFFSNNQNSIQIKNDNEINNEKKDSNENKNIKLNKKRKENRKNKKMHSAFDDDNILRKIQVHFLSFVTNYINDILKEFVTDKTVPFFKNIDYKIKKTVNHRFVEELKSKNIAEILQLRPSPKMKIHDESVNKNIYNIVISICPFMNEYLQRSYISLFNDYYYNKNKIFIVNGRIIPLSPRTKTFCDLINKNYAYKEKIKYIAINYILNKYKRLKKPNFKIRVVNKNKVQD